MPIGMREWYYRRLVKAKKEENDQVKKAQSKYNRKK
jgi:hypothetical protein|tara:strand:+ start:115 stop:222 length:108 start_codon:yes stop_codon:yes gene_type:complete